jgi:hypothetical protein
MSNGDFPEKAIEIQAQKATTDTLLSYLILLFIRGWQKLQVTFK